MNGDAQRAAPTEPMGCAKAAAATKGPDQVQGRRDFYAILKASTEDEHTGHWRTTTIHR